MNSTAAATVTIGRIGTGAKVHRVHGDATNCNSSGRPQRIHGIRKVTREQAASLVTCERCA